MGEEVKEACGVFGVYGDLNAAHTAYLGLYGLQHRGTESCGIASSDGIEIYLETGMGLVPDVFSKGHFVNGNSKLKGHIAIGHDRYSTTGSSCIENAQPIVLDTKFGKVAIAHNGNLTNTESLKSSLEGIAYQSTTDSEVILHLINRSKADNLEGAIVDALGQIKGSYSLVISSSNALYVARDPNGFRPLLVGRRGSAVVAGSEEFAFTMADAEYHREVEPGELLVVDADTIGSGTGYRSRQFADPSRIKLTRCLLEGVYFARPDHHINGLVVAMMRRRFGQKLAGEHPVDADMVSPIPDSGNYAALGYSEESKIPFDLAYVRSHFGGRTFMLPDQADREAAVKAKLAAVKELVDGKRIIVVDDSIIRGTTSRNRIRLLRDAGAKEVHLRISCPMTKHPCFYGFDFSTYEELIAWKKNNDVEEIRRHVEADTLGFLSLEGMLEAAGGKDWCTACWTGKYPVTPEDFNAGLLKGKVVK